MMERNTTRKSVRQFIVYVLVFCILFNTSLPIALAEYVNPVVVEGTADFQQNGNTTTITTTTNQTIIRYDQFDVLHNETVNFMQPNSGSNVMNRINSASPTSLNGTIMSNGGVYWLNPAGVIIGNGATINVTKLVASALDMSNNDFMDGIDRFDGSQKGVVINEGNINAESVYLVAEQVLNTGTIISPNGHVVMAAGDRVFIGEQGSNIVVEIDSSAIGSDGFSNLPLPDMANLTNEGTIEAAGGKIILAAAGDAIASPMLANLGTLSTSSEQGDAGDISIIADNGDIVLGSESLITANAGLDGDGGEVIIDSSDTAIFSEGAVIEIKGGAQSGNGGFAEISGKEDVQIHGLVYGEAPNGQRGKLLIDPTNITISNSGNVTVTWLENQLNTGGVDVTVTTNIGGSETGWLHVDEAFGWATDMGLTLDSYRDMEINAAITNTGGGHLELLGGQATGSADIAIHANITAGSIRIKSGRDTSSESSYSGIYTGGTYVRSGGESWTLGTPVALEATDGDLVLQAVHNIILNGDVSATGDIFINADENGWGYPALGDGYHPSYVAGGDFIAYSTIAAGGNVDIIANGIYLGSDVTATNGDLNITGRISKDTEDNILSKFGLSENSGPWGDIVVAAPLAGDDATTLSAGQNVYIIDAGGEGTDDIATGKMALTGHDSLAIVAGTAGGVDNGEIIVDNTTIAVTGSELLLEQDLDLDVADAQWDFLGSQATTALTLASNEGSVTSTGTADGGRDENAADQWASIGATAYDGVTLKGSGDITTNELTSATNNISVHSTGGNLIVNDNVTAAYGGVRLLADNTEANPGKGKIYTAGGDSLNVAVSGYSDHMLGIGVDLPKNYDLPDEDTGKAAIVIMSEDTLKLGSAGTLTAAGTYYNGASVDDRPGVDFRYQHRR